MNYKQYRNSRIVISAVLAAIMAEAVIINNYLLALGAVLVAVAIMFVIKKQIKDVLVDERDYEVAGKSARYTLAIFPVLAVIAMSFFMFQRDKDPVYGVIGSVLAYSICSLMLIYSFIFIYLQKYAK